MVEEVRFELLKHRKVHKIGDPVSLKILPPDHVLMFFPQLLLLLFECLPSLRSDYL